ncbi:response regulator receiver modulated diguanylate cyclase [[Leptolyngbya] sp. PCC 7376]|uniref:GGDEF domain-containing response regulator n=1 Tax=[Leptolyngbya] sp. PCC 7376 TaxID=111781 RepID=UPI00029F0841|nr:diguanylate cyclase [[Leptolyngbya] sp. PCC 7376]AFY40348.1 response regulator receiver modulated diguanylate cyclase [[Leptolyngbya] sp. PCC 7376]
MNAPAAREEKAKILIVDDSITNLKLLAAILAQHNYAMTVVKKAIDALKYLEKNSIDLILLELSMLGSSAYQLCTILKSRIRTKHIPIIFLGGTAQSVDKLKAFSVGASDFITAPNQSIEILARVELHLNLSRQRKKLLTKNKILEVKIKQHRRMEALLLQQTTKLRKEIQQQKDMGELLRLRNIRLKRQANTDPLTHVANRRYFDRYLSREFKHCMREHHPLSLVLCDIDYFKFYNDHYGHQQGDDCLHAVAQILASVANLPNDLVARYGGEEFALILPDTDQEAAIAVVECIQRILDKKHLQHNASEVADRITLSFGGVTLLPNQTCNIAMLIKQADDALYKAKNNGRSRHHWHKSRFESLLTAAPKTLTSHPVPTKINSSPKSPHPVNLSEHARKQVNL